ncbi:MAG: 2-hydroxychromene-2-carboxylate isomerase [Robiginitomaculum sp.]|nr:2-hydroxychromene-2-carboxylate isomerase [Robiginitomaculum sp.]
MPTPIEFWFEFASSYSYLSVMRVDGEAKKRGVSVTWRPFLLGPAFKAHGWDTSPFRVYPLKEKYMWRDMERRSAALGIEFNRPPPDKMDDFPQFTVTAARIAILGLEQNWGKDFCRSVCRAEWIDSKNIADKTLLEKLALQAGAPPNIMAQANQPDTKLKLRAQTESATKLNIFGAPSFIVGEELFWGDDRLEDALNWATRQST